MRKFLTVVTIYSLALFNFVTPVLAQGIGIINVSQYDSIEEVIFALFSLFQPIVVFVLVGMIIYGGWNYLTSQGEPDKIKKAKQIITYAIVGFVLIVLAPQLVRLIATVLGVNPDLVRVT